MSEHFRRVMLEKYRRMGDELTVIANRVIESSDRTVYDDLLSNNHNCSVDTILMIRHHVGRAYAKVDKWGEACCTRIGLAAAIAEVESIWSSLLRAAPEHSQ